MTMHDLQGLDQAYDYAVYDRNMVPIEQGRKWVDTFNYLVDLSGLSKMEVACYVTARREILAGIDYSDSVMDTLKAGAEAILQAPGDALNAALAPITGPESPVGKLVKPLLWGGGAILAVLLGKEILSTMGRKG